MTKRRMTALILIAAAGAMLSLGTLSVLLRCAGRTTAGTVAGVVERMTVPTAAAQEAMEFKAVPAESVPDPEGRRARRGPAPAAPSGLEVPAAPVPPELPPAPRRHREFRSSRSGDIVRFGSDIHVPAGQTVEGDVVAMGGDVSVDGQVRGDVVAIGGDVSLGATADVDGEVVTLGGQLREEPGARVGGQRVSAGRFPRAWLGGPFLGFMGLVGSGVKAGLTIAKMGVVLLIAWGFTQLAPKRTRVAFDTFKREPLMCFGIGLLAWALVIPSIVALALVVAILCITIIGIPLALAVILGYVLGFLLLIVWGYVVGASVLGQRLAAQFGRSLESLTLMAVWGIVALTAIKVVGHLFGGIPMGGFAGGLLVLLATVGSGVLVTIGAGALLRTQWRRDTFGQWWPVRPAVSGPVTAAASAASSPGSASSSPVAPGEPSAPSSPSMPAMPSGDPQTPPPAAS